MGNSTLILFQSSTNVFQVVILLRCERVISRRYWRESSVSR